jgi:hypothetical protein
MGLADFMENGFLDWHMAKDFSAMNDYAEALACGHRGEPASRARAGACVGL